MGTRVLASLPQGFQPPSLPAADEFRAVVNEFWFWAVWNAKHLRRGELWSAKTEACDGRMKALLLRMIEWHTHATHGADYDTWADGRHLDDWADPQVLVDVRATFGHYDEDDLWRASLATMNLFRTVATETAERLHLPYPTSADAGISEWIRRCEAGRSRARKDQSED